MKRISITLLLMVAAFFVNGQNLTGTNLDIRNTAKVRDWIIYQGDTLAVWEDSLGNVYNRNTGNVIIYVESGDTNAYTIIEKNNEGNWNAVTAFQLNDTIASIGIGYSSGAEDNQPIVQLYVGDGLNTSVIQVQKDSIKHMTEMSIFSGQVFVPDIEAAGAKYDGYVAGIGIDDRLFPKSIVDLFNEQQDTLAKMSTPSPYAMWTRDSTKAAIYQVQLTDKVGIGTNSPTVKLDVVGNIKADTVFENHLSNKKWVIFGDSFSNSLTADYPANVIKKLKFTGTVTNGISGATIKQMRDTLDVKLAADANYLDAFNIITLLAGVNDLSGATTLGNRYDASTSSNISGYLQDFIITALTANPSIEVYIMTPPETNSGSLPYGVINSAGWSLKNLSVLINQICSDYAVQCIDLYSISQFNEQTIATLTADGLHPNAAGNLIIGDIIADAFSCRTNAGNAMVNNGAGNLFTVNNYNKYYPLLISTDLPILKHSTYYWSGSAYVATQNYNFGIDGQLYNKGANSINIGYQGQYYNTGNFCNNVGNKGQYLNSSESSNNVGYSGQQFNSGTSANSLGSLGQQYNVGSYSNNIGHRGQSYNRGDYADNIGALGMELNLGDSSSGIGYISLRYNEGKYNSALGALAFAAFADNTADEKTFDYTDIDAAGDTITITSHGFGSAGVYTNLRYTEGTSAITGLTDGEVYQFIIIDANNLKGVSTNITAVGTGTGHTLTPQFTYTNSTAIGYNSQPTSSNQVVLGNANTEQVVTNGNMEANGLVMTDPTNWIDMMRQRPFYMTDFLWSATGYVDPWAPIAVASGTLTYGGAANHPGYTTIISSTTTNSGYYIMIRATSLYLQGGEMSNSIIYPIVVDSITTRFGFHDASSASAPVDGAYIEIAPGGEASGKTMNNSTGSTTGTTYTLSAATWYRLKVVVNADATRVDYYIYNDAGTELWTNYLTANIPTARATGHGIISTKEHTGTGAGISILNVDYMDVYLGTLTR